MDAYLDLISVRVVREYAGRPIEDDSLRRILEAGRVTGSSQNRQEWRFYVARNRETLRRLAPAVFAPDNVAGSQAVIGIASTAKSGFDVGRCAQNMILAAWAEGIGSAPNGARDAETAGRVLGLAAGERLVTAISLGYPAHPHVPDAGDVTGILQRIKRKPLEEVAVWVD